MVKRAARIDVPSVQLVRGMGRPLAVQLADQLRDAIACGRIPVGARLPASRVLATTLGVSRNTVLQAYDELLTDRLIAGRIGAGSFVRQGIAQRRFRDPEGNLLILRTPARTALAAGYRPHPPR